MSEPRVKPTLSLVSDLSGLADEELMLRYRGGDVAAFDTLVLRHRSRVYSFLLRRLRSPERAEELLSEVFLKLHRAAPRYEPEARFTTYLFTIAYRACLNAQARLRNRRDQGVGDTEDLEQTAALVASPVASPASGATPKSPEHSLRTQRAVRRLDDELGRLPEGQLEIFLLYYREGLSIPEVAECLGLKSSEVKGRLAYARKLLRQRMADFLREGGGDLT